ncbi:MAG: hypothetical protein CMN78_05515 [Spirochaetales bacterium]|nr:hypothetical protein [Spirochaetales bacterium]
MRSPYALQKRKKKNRTVYYIRFGWSEESGRYAQTKATNYTTKTEARREAERMLSEGVVSTENDPHLTDYLRDFWQSDSQYGKSKAARGKPLSHGYLELNKWAVESLVASYRPFQKTRISAINPGIIENWLLEALDAGRGERVVNIALQSMKVACKWWAKQNRAADPLSAVEKVHEKKEHARGALTVAELRLLLDVEAPEIPRCAVMLAALAGLRVSEVRGLRWEDVDGENGILHIRNQVTTNFEIEKEPKHGSVGDVPVPDILLDEMENLVVNSPYGKAGYVLYSIKPEKPYGYKAISRQFRAMLRKIGIDDEAQRGRNLSFHSLRHTFVSLARLSGVPDFVVRGFARHKSAAMTENYSHHEIIDFDEYRRKMSETIGSHGAISD